MLIKSWICITCCFLNKELSDLGDTCVYRFLFTFPPKLSCPLLLGVDDKPWNFAWKKNAKLELVSSHIDLSGCFFFPLKTVAKLGRSRKTNLWKTLPKDFGKQHFSAKAVVTSACGWSSRAVKRREGKKPKYVSCHCRKSAPITSFF